MTLRAWANAHDVDGRSLHAWRMNLGRGAPPQALLGRAALVELVPQATVGEPVEVDVRARYRILCGGMAVEVDAHFDEGVLRRLLGVVASC